MIGLVDRERVDAALYDDYESEKAREVSILLAIFLFALNLSGRMLENIWRNLVSGYVMSSLGLSLIHEFNMVSFLKFLLFLFVVCRMF